MNESRIAKKIFELSIPAAVAMEHNVLIEKMTPSYFEGNKARKEDLKCSTSRLFLINSIISRYYENVYPGKGTILLDFSYKILRPVNSDNLYRVEIGFPIINSNQKFYESLVKILDSNENVCLFAYYKLTRK